MSRIRIETVAIAASKQVCLSSMVVLLLAVAATPWAQAQTYEVLHQFHGKDGAVPLASLFRDAAGNLYGTNQQAGDDNCSLPIKAVGCGVVFELDTTGKGTVLHTFTGGADGSGSNAGLIGDAAGNLYGTTEQGGDSSCTAFGCGVVFKLNPDTRELTALYAFTDGADGAFPVAGLIRDAAGNLYGTTYGGGDLDNCTFVPGCGVVFKLETTGKETVLHTFTGKADGEGPFAGVIRDTAGNLYGTTAYGGDLKCNPPTGCGVVFKLDTTGKETVLHTFAGKADGGSPIAGVIRDTAGNLYGTTQDGGDLKCSPPSGCGVVFKLDTTGKEMVLHTFTGGKDGSFPDAGVIRDAAGNLYGTAAEGGDPSCGCGVVFKLTP